MVDKLYSIYEAGIKYVLISFNFIYCNGLFIYKI